MRKKRRKFSLKRLRSRIALIGHNAIECIKEYPTVKREVPISIVDIISMVCALGISVVTIIFMLFADTSSWPAHPLR